MHDIITAITEEKSRVQVVVNGETALWLSHSVFRERPFTVRETIDLAEVQEWLLVREYPVALNRAVAFLAVRARSTLEVRQKLQEKHYMEHTIELVLYKLEKEQLVNDEAFAKDWAKARLHRQLGKTRILQELRQKGVQRDMAERALSELAADEEMEDPALALACKLLKRVEKEPDAQKAMNRVMAAMARRGFSFEEAKAAVASALEALQAESGD